MTDGRIGITRGSGATDLQVGTDGQLRWKGYLKVTCGQIQRLKGRMARLGDHRRP